MPLPLALLLLLPMAPAVFAQDVSFTQAPRDRQLFPRDANDVAPVVCSGAVSDPGHDAMMLVIRRDGEFWGMDRTDLIYDPPHGAPFHLSCQIIAGLAEYTASLFLDDELILVRDSLVCGDVLLINGQSNAMTVDYEGLATWQSEWLRSFGTSYPTAAECMADSSWHLAQGHTYYASAAIGVWGLCLGSWLIEDYGVPIAILNGAVSGTAILSHQRHDDNPENLYTIYGRLLWRARRAGVAQAVRAILWHQGESDTDDHWIHYAQRFDSLWSDWHEDYSSLEKTYVFQVHPGCGGEFQSQLREVQRRLPDTYADLEVMATGGCRAMNTMAATTSSPAISRWRAGSAGKLRGISTHRVTPGISMLPISARPTTASRPPIGSVSVSMGRFPGLRIRWGRRLATISISMERLAASCRAIWTRMATRSS